MAGTSGLLMLMLSSSSSLSAPVLLLGEQPPPPRLPPPPPRLVLVLVLLSPEPLRPREEPPRRKRGCSRAAAGGGGKEPDEDETARGLLSAGCIVLPGAPRSAQLLPPRQPRAGEAAEGSRGQQPPPPPQLPGLVPGLGSTEIRTGATGLGEPSPGWLGAGGRRGAERTAGMVTAGEAGAEAGSEPSRQKRELAAGKPGLDSRGRGETRGGESLACWIRGKKRRRRMLRH